MEVNQEKKWCVYKHTNKVNGKVYIGQTCQDPEDRWKGGSGYKKCSYFYKAIKKYGWDNFKHEILFNNLTEEEANAIEILMIAYYSSNESEFGYNLYSGGKHYVPNEMSKENLSRANRKSKYDISKEKNPMWGKHHTKEAKRKMSKAKENYFGENNPFYNRRHSEESKKKISVAKGHPVQCVETGKVYTGMTEAQKETGANRKGIYYCCIGKQEMSGGYHWKYADVDEDED